MKKVARRSFIIGAVAGIIVCLAVLAVVLKPKMDYLKGLDDAYGKYYEIVSLIEDEALAEYDPEEVNDEMLKDLVESLDDPYAKYYTADEYAAFIKRYAESFIGIGLNIADTAEGDVIVVKVIEDSPAAEAGIQIGDYVRSIDGKKVTNSDEASVRMSGDNGTDVVVTIERGYEQKDVTMTRSRIEEKSVEYKICDEENKIGFIWIRTFKTGTAKEFKLAVKDLKNQGCTKCIIDLRSNGGGSTEEAYKIGDYLLPECVMLNEKNKKGENKEVTSDAGCAGIEYVILVDDATASASEMVSGAVKDNKGGKIIGVTTFGKGVSQMTHQFDDGSAIKLTIEEFFTPNGDKINGVGIKPDIEFKDVDDTTAATKKAIEVLMK